MPSNTSDLTVSDIVRWPGLKFITLGIAGILVLMLILTAPPSASVMGTVFKSRVAYQAASPRTKTVHHDNAYGTEHRTTQTVEFKNIPTYEITVNYEVDGNSYTVTDRVRKTNSSLEPGASVKVYYRPGNPSDAKCTSPQSRIRIFFYILITVFSLTSVGLFVVGLSKQNEMHSGSQEEVGTRSDQEIG